MFIIIIIIIIIIIHATEGMAVKDTEKVQLIDYGSILYGAVPAAEQQHQQQHQQQQQQHHHLLVHLNLVDLVHHPLRIK